ncbi:1,4-alpha-glucan branching protein GlgB [Thalassotalea sp. LPB0316]|uniref:1,4-alpha-glucan branching protein GlgB n=1 Tax=Thalassotalea sp. LPB0316 TaxID=2769490 RepID=UPI001866793C|nr:1,4-alpha-glucan branching protein GlgB [Thalassotalea sp. LPB0316]QOL26810.1 1,4-alpha-glucan branching protein GlgB [Thalassotalea sp. LPB0316]
MTDTNAINGIISAQHNQPHQVLGLHADDSGYLTLNAFVPKAQAVAVYAKNTKKVIAKLNKIDDAGFFSKKLRRKNSFDYQLEITVDGKTSRVEDPFAFAPTLGELDLHLLREGNHLHPYNILGAHLKTVNGVKGVSFALWAPNAKRVSVVGEFNNWDGRCHPMTNQDFSGYWSLFIPQLKAGELYKFEILRSDGNLQPLKADPYGLQAQFRPETASIVNAEKHYKWQDKAWLKVREARNSRHAPISIYEVHLGSWQRDENNHYLNYRELADQLIPYTLEMGFTHIQLMPVSEFPYDGSWGYQPVGLFAPSSRFGDADDFKYFVDQCHQANLGVLIDWVPGHFPIDQHGLAQFDGTHLYEHADPRQGFHPDWNTLIYNYGRTEVANFLRASALHWLDRFHVDGIRVDAVASMLYLDYSRKEGEWIPNEHGGRENLEAVAFLQRFNEELYREYPGTFSVAEESTSWPGVSKPTDAGGLGFGYKWNMGWMNDTLEYIKREPIHRKHHHNEISFGLVYAFDENFILPISHDEVVHGKGSMIERMPGDAWQQFANLRAYYGFMWSHPGKKLLFMGCEYGQGPEWNYEKALEWHQLDIHWHAQVQQLVKDLNRVYQATPALYQHDCEHQGFAWLDHENAEQSVYSFIRFGQHGEAPVVVVCNFSDQVYHNFTVGVPEQGHYQELLNTDAQIYGGSNQGNFGGATSKDKPMDNQAQSIDITVPPLATLIFKLES